MFSNNWSLQTLWLVTLLSKQHPVFAVPWRSVRYRYLWYVSVLPLLHRGLSWKIL